MYCKLNHGDHPYRVKSSGSRIVHAARDRSKHGGQAHTACGLWADTFHGWTILEDRPTITCKTCMRTLGIIMEPETNIRFVIYDGATRMYYRRTHYSGKWVEHIYEATRWRNKITADLTVSSIAHERWYAIHTGGKSYRDLANFRASRKFKVRVRAARLMIQLVD